MHVHTSFAAWAAVFAVAVALVAWSVLARPVRRHLPRLPGCAGAGVLVATAVTALVDRHLSRHPAHGAGMTTALVTGFVVTAAVVTVAGLVFMAARDRRRPRRAW